MSVRTALLLGILVSHWIMVAAIYCEVIKLLKILAAIEARINARAASGAGTYPLPSGVVADED